MAANHSLHTPSKAYAVTPSDTTPLTGDVRRIYVGGAGNIRVAPAAGGDTVTLIGVPVGTTIELQVSMVYATGTTATNLVAFAG